MKILVAFPMKDKQTGLFIKRAFRDLGHEVDHCDSKTEPKNLFTRANKMQADLVFCSRTKELLPQIQKLKKEMPETVTACWNVDKRSTVKQFGVDLLNLFNEVDLFYTIALGNIAEYEIFCPDTEVQHLQQGCELRVHRPMVSDGVMFTHDVSFCGNYESKTHRGRRELFQFLKNHIEAQEKPQWNLNLHGNQNQVWDEEHSMVCGLSQINLSHNGWPDIAMSPSVRVYKIMAAGGFLLEEWCEGIEEWFQGTIATYKTNEECLSKIEYYLEDGAPEAAEMAERGMNLVRSKHKYLDRMRVVQNDVIAEAQARKRQTV